VNAHGTRSFEIIPVIDLAAGVVVHARRGERDRYRPIETPLARSSQPLDVVSGLLELHAFTTLYIADLDAITQRGDHHAEIARIGKRFPSLELWIDAGVRTAADYRIVEALGTVVIGAETLSDTALLGSVKGAVLSLDFRGTDFLGPAALLNDARRWPTRVIAMNLARVGAGEGPDLALVAELHERAPHAGVYAAGGVRDIADLRAAGAAGAAGALVATSLHDGRLTRADIARLYGER
jgi:phosphoribosylformimino-5-aminoimidazole carboxamide ribotide isomerase